MAAGFVSRTPHFVLHRCALAPLPAQGTVRAAALAPLQLPQAVWLGALLPKRWARRAVTRNTIRRQVAAVSQDCLGSLPQAAHVVRLRAAFDPKQYVSARSDALKAAVRQELLRLFATAPAMAPAAANAAAAGKGQA